jgi:hypothetical protein
MAIQVEQSASLRFSPPRRGRVGVIRALSLCRFVTPILAFPHQGERNRIGSQLPASLISVSILVAPQTTFIQETLIT